jgi:transposase
MSRIPKIERAQYTLLKEQGWRITDIARKYNRQYKDVKRWVDRAAADPSDGAVLDRARSGRKRKTTEKQDEKIVAQYKKNWRPNKKGRRKIEKELRENAISGVPAISAKTVYRRLKERSGKSMKSVPQKFFLSSVNITKRKKWARSIKGEDFSRWIFSDETKFTVGGRKRKAFEFEGESLSDVKFAHPVSQQVWACMSRSGPGEMEFIDGILTGIMYKAILKKKLHLAARKLFPTGAWKFQQDNDPKHTSRVVKDWLEENNVELVEWPSQSPDMNVQENLHNIWKDRVDALHPTTRQDLRKKIKKVFYEMTAEDTRPLVDSMRQRVESLRKAKGGHTKY